MSARETLPETLEHRYFCIEACCGIADAQNLLLPYIGNKPVFYRIHFER
jgi:hypothetical protein